MEGNFGRQTTHNIKSWLIKQIKRANFSKYEGYTRAPMG